MTYTLSCDCFTGNVIILIHWIFNVVFIFFTGFKREFLCYLCTCFPFVAISKALHHPNKNCNLYNSLRVTKYLKYSPKIGLIRLSYLILSVLFCANSIVFCGVLRCDFLPKYSFKLYYFYYFELFYEVMFLLFVI
jgi:hypothetical protein